MRKSSLSLWGSSDTQGWRSPCFCWVGSELLPLPWPLLTPWWGALLPPGDAEISKTPLSLLRPPQERGGAVARYCWVGCNSGFPVCCPLTLHRAFGTKVLSPPWGASWVLSVSSQPCEDGSVGSHWLLLAHMGAGGASFHGTCLKILCLAGLPFPVLRLQRTGLLCVRCLCPPCSDCQLHQGQVWEQAGTHSLPRCPRP